MKRSSNKFLHRVRIHGGEFDASARAMHRDGMTSSFQAAAEKLSIATNERKQMSTKTTFKRVALVTVAALGFGLLSTVPSQAVVSIDTLTLSSATAAQTTAETYTATSAVVTLSFAGAVADSMTITTSVTGNTSTELAQPYLRLVETSSAVVGDTLTGTTSVPLALKSLTAVNTAVNTNAISDTVRTTAKFAVYLSTGGSGLAAPTKAGVYTIKITPANKTAGGPLNATAQTLTITVTTDATLSTVATTATSVLTAGDTTTSAAGVLAPTTDDVVTSAMTASTSAEAATIKVTLKNASATTTTGESYTATISGSGTLGSGTMTTTTNGSSIGRAITVKAGDVVSVYPDGTSGVGTITINSALGVILATEKVTFFGDAATVVTTVASAVLATGSNADAISVVVKDAASTVVSNATLYVTSDATTKVSNSYATSCTWTAATQNYLCSLTGVAAGTANITVGTKSSSTATTGVNGTAVAVRVGSTTAASIAWTLDKSSYVPGEKATLTATLLDSTGLLVAAGDYASIMKTTGLKPSRELGVSSDTLTATTIHAVVDGVRTYTIYMPLTEGDLTITGTTAGTAVTGTAPSALSGLLVANQAVAISLTASVVSASGTAATDAANEATDAANAATDAANAAAEAADAATAAAQDAADAVAALSTEVATLIAALKAQITSLTNLVIKIQKKVKA
jgi:trimeric autotransporter adhesin